MAVTQPNVSIDLTINTGCGGVSLTDTTGVYNGTTNTGGYGLPNGPTVNNVTGVEIIFTYNSQSNDITYNFTVVSGVITAATLTIASGTPADILTALPSTAWPFTIPFDLTGDYGVTIPTFADDIYSAEYTITGTSPDVFSFTAVRNISVECQTQCCIDKKWIAIDFNCNCDNNLLQTAFYGQALLNQADNAATYGDLDNAILALTKAKALCTTQECGCS